MKDVQIKIKYIIPIKIFLNNGIGKIKRHQPIKKFLAWLKILKGNESSFMCDCKSPFNNAR